MDSSVYFRPVPGRIAGKTFKKNMLGSQFSIFKDSNDFPDLEGIQVALFGIQESRGHEANQGCEHAPDAVRGYLYSLFKSDHAVRVADLGNIAAGESYQDTGFAIQEVCEQLMRKNIVPLIIGGSQDLTYSIYRAYEKMEETINVATIDARIDLTDVPEEETNGTNYLNRIALHQPNYLFNLSNIGNQRYLNDPDIMEMVDRMYFDTYRLGIVNEKIDRTEPVLRNADLVSVDISSVRQSEAPGCAHRGPNGLRSEELCQMTWYAGMSDKLSSFGIFEVNPELDVNGQTTQLAAQAIWCFLDGFSMRKEDYPKSSLDDCTRYTVHLESSGHDLVFYKSTKTDRWWLDVPYPAGMANRYERHHIVPCTYEEYLQAAEDEVPDRYWRTFQKLV